MQYILRLILFEKFILDEDVDTKEVRLQHV